MTMNQDGAPLDKKIEVGHDGKVWTMYKIELGGDREDALEWTNAYGIHYARIQQRWHYIRRHWN